MKYRHFPIDRIASNDGIVVVQSEVIGKNEINNAVSKNIYFFNCFFFQNTFKVFTDSTLAKVYEITGIKLINLHKFYIAPIMVANRRDLYIIFLQKNSFSVDVQFVKVSINELVTMTNNGEYMISPFCIYNYKILICYFG